MPTIANMPGADVKVQMPSGKVKTINLIRMLVQVQNAEFKVEHGMFLPGVGKLHPTVKALRQEYEIPLEMARTWEQIAVVLRNMYAQLSENHKK